LSGALRHRWVEVESVFESLIDLDSESRLQRLTEIAIVDLELANAVGELLAADGIERTALDLDAALLVAAVRGGLPAAVAAAPAPVPAVVPDVSDPADGTAQESDATVPPPVPAFEAGSVRSVITTPALPRKIGPYRIRRRVGQGSAGEVFEADRDGQKVAVKRLLSGHGGTEIERRFGREKEILAALDHPAIARLRDAGSDSQGRAYLVLDWIEGTDIVTFVRERRLPEVERIRLFLRLCEAVEAAHRLRVLHRDLKPSNILVDDEGWPKLLDFGIAKLLDDSGSGRETASGVWLFTLDYAAPEQILGRRPGPAADQFSLAVILHELLAGERPLHRGGKPISRVLREIERERPARLPWGDRDLRAIVSQALAADPAARHACVGDFGAALAVWLAERAPAPN
jgi:eukaryotic-like serine/threonine-protein kinase